MRPYLAQQLYTNLETALGFAAAPGGRYRRALSGFASLFLLSFHPLTSTMQPENLAPSVSAADRQLIAAAYSAFNARQLDAVLATMHPDVAWPRAWEGDHVQGAAQVRAYWAQQWQEISPVVEPVALSRLPDGRTAVLVQQTVHDLGGQLLHAGQTTHIYTIREGLIQRMDIQPTQ